VVGVVVNEAGCLSPAGAMTGELAGDALLPALQGEARDSEFSVRIV
jgi:hypothetical protein